MSDEARRLVGSLYGAELAYAQAYAEHLSVGDPRPEPPAGVDPKLCEDIRKMFDREWASRIHRSPALSGRLRIERRVRRE